jgi:flagellar hook protein FlgE
MAVRGRGFLPVAETSDIEAGNGAPQMQLITTGSFRTDANGYLVTETGLVLLGWPASTDGTVPVYPRDTSDGLEPVQINVNQFSGEPTTRVSLGLNLPATETYSTASGDALNLSVEYYDNLGVSETIDINFTPVLLASGASNTWRMEITDSATGGTLIGEYELVFDDSRSSGGTLLSVTTLSGGAYDPSSGSFVANVASGPIEVSIGNIGENDGITQLSDSFAPLNISKDGSPVGNMTSVEIDENGFVHAYFDTGITRTIYQVPLVDLPNPNGLIALDNQVYIPSPESGSYFLWNAADGPTGDIVSYAREESTTDVASELTNLIQTQRAYSSNAKVIQTVDEMLQETTNIKR